MTDLPPDLLHAKETLHEFLDTTPAAEFLNGVGITGHGPAGWKIYVMLKQRDGELHVPFEWHNWPVVTEVVGEVRAL